MCTLWFPSSVIHWQYNLTCRDKGELVATRMLMDLQDAARVQGCQHLQDKEGVHRRHRSPSVIGTPLVTLQ